MAHDVIFRRDQDQNYFALAHSTYSLQYTEWYCRFCHCSSHHSPTRYLLDYIGSQAPDQPQVFKACLKPQHPPPRPSFLSPIRREMINCWAVDIFMVERALSKTRSSRKKNGHTIKQSTGEEIYICNRRRKMYSASIIREIPILNISIYQTGSFVKTISCLKSEAAPLPPSSHRTNPPWGQALQNKGAFPYTGLPLLGIQDQIRPEGHPARYLSQPP